MADIKQIILSQDQEIALVNYGQRAQQMMMNQFSVRSMLADIDRYYQREKDWTEAEWRARIANRAGDASKFRDVTLPVIMPQVEAALGYLTNVFLTGYPIFGVSSTPDQENAALMLETIIAENSQTAGWARQLMMFFRDGLKYNLHAIECEWGQKSVYSIENKLDMPNGAAPKAFTWKGNILKRLDLYNTFFDTRVAPATMHEKGEFAGYTEIYSRTMFKKYINDLFGTVSIGVAKKALESSPASGVATSGSVPYVYYIPLINPFPLMLQQNIAQFDWMGWAQNNRQSPLQYSNIYIVTKLYARIIPDDFGLRVPEANTPQVWKFIIVNGSVILTAERQSNAHNYIPLFFGQPIEDGLNYQTKSFASNVMDMQEVGSAMLNGFIASKRRLVTDRVLYDPLRVTKKDINSPNPSAKIPVRPAAYGKDIKEAVYAFPYRDDQADSFLIGVKLVSSFADLINGQNPAQQGQFVKGNKTLHEYDDVMGHGNNRNQLMAIMTENQVLTPLKETIKLNILQFQEDGVNIYNTAQKQDVKIDQSTLRQSAAQFKVSDGIIPADKEMSTEELTAALQAIGSSPQIAQGYNIAPLFTYIMKLRGADLTPFEKSQEQVQYEQQLAAWQQMAEVFLKSGKEGEFKTPMPQPPASMQQQQQGGTGDGGGASAGGQNSSNSGASVGSATNAALASTQG